MKAQGHTEPTAENERFAEVRRHLENARSVRYVRICHAGVEFTLSARWIERLRGVPCSQSIAIDILHGQLRTVSCSSDELVCVFGPNTHPDYIEYPEALFSAFLLPEIIDSVDDIVLPFRGTQH